MFELLHVLTHLFDCWLVLTRNAKSWLEVILIEICE